MEPVVVAIVDLYRSVHEQLRQIIQDMDDEELNWSPGPEMNSVAVLVTHTLASELDTLTFVRDVPNERDRESEFQVEAASASDLLASLDRADAVLAEHAGALGPGQLDAIRTRPGRDPQQGVHWLINNYGHAREHLGHAQLTKLLYEQRQA
ncbi:MAG TPA: DinB family protein [Thermomicrobiales bacterium]|nr:DinB family protein [Thermomicrobiales bacterium]